MLIDTLTIHCFLAVANTGSFSKAAERICRTQSAVSQQISKLEKLLDRSLIIRGKELTLTSEGEIFLSYARQIFTLHSEAIDRFKQLELEGEVRFGLPEDFAAVFLSDVLVDFTQIHPRILLNVECDLTLNLFERFKRGNYDLILVKTNRPEDFSNGREIWSEKLQWVGNKKQLEFFVSNNKPLPLILSPQPCVYRARTIKALEEASIRWQLVFSSPSYAGKAAAAKAGLGITVLPKTMVPHDLELLDHEYLPTLCDTHISLLKHNGDNAAVNSFEEFVLKRLHLT